MVRALTLLCVAMLTSLACTTSSASDGSLDAPMGPVVLFAGQYSIGIAANLGTSRLFVGAVQSARDAIRAGNVQASPTARQPVIFTQLASLDPRFAGPNAAALAFSPSRLVGDAADALARAGDDPTRAMGRARLDAALQVALVLSAENELADAAAAIAQPGAPTDGGTVDPSALDAGPDAMVTADWTGIGDDWDRAAVYTSGLTADLAVERASTAYDVAAPGLAPLTRTDLVATFADALGRGRGSASAQASTQGAALVVAVRIALTRPLLLAALARAGAIEWGQTDPAHADPTAAASMTMLDEGVLQSVAALTGVDVTAARALVAVSVAPRSLVAANASVFVAAADALVRGFDATSGVSASSAIAGVGAMVEVFAEVLARAGFDVAALRASVLAAQVDLDGGNVASARARCVAVRNTLAALVGAAP